MAYWTLNGRANMCEIGLASVNFCDLEYRDSMQLIVNKCQVVENLCQHRKAVCARQSCDECRATNTQTIYKHIESIIANNFSLNLCKFIFNCV